MFFAVLHLSLLTDSICYMPCPALPSPPQAKMSLQPGDMFKPPHCALYASWDDAGLPLTLLDGEKLSKSNSKKLKKEFDKQKKLYESNNKKA
jgi:hypothetical protein